MFWLFSDPPPKSVDAIKYHSVTGIHSEIKADSGPRIGDDFAVDCKVPLSWEN